MVVALLAAQLAGPKRAAGEDYVTAQQYIHAFNNNITVLSTVFALNRDFTLDTSTYAKYTVDLVRPGLFEDDDDNDDDEGGGGGGDAVSGASGAASGVGNDTRHEVTVGVTHNLRNLFGVELYYDYSKERDFTSSTPTVTLKKELFKKNTTLTFGYSRNMDTISGKFLAADESRRTNNYYLGITQVLTPLTVVQGGYSHVSSEGFLSEGVRIVPVDGVAASTCTAESATCVDEAFPGSRTRRAYILGINHYLKGQADGDDTSSSLMASLLGPLYGRASIKTTFRYYTDDWDIKSYTGEVEYYKYLSERNLLRVNYRFYTQGEPFFFKESYLSTDEFKSSSPQHRNLTTHLGGVKLSHTLEGRIGVGPYDLGPLPKGTVEGKYELFGESSGALAHVAMVSCRLLF